MAEGKIRRKPGPRAGASREAVIAAAREEYLACRRVEMQPIATACGVGRATMYRWFGGREGLIGEAMVSIVEEQTAQVRTAVGGHGVEALLQTLDVLYRGLVASPHIRSLIDREPRVAASVMTSSAGVVHPRMVSVIQGLLDDEVASGDYRPPLDTGTLAYILVRLSESLVLSEDVDVLTRDIDRLEAATRVLLGAPVEPPPSETS